LTSKQKTPGLFPLKAYRLSPRRQAILAAIGILIVLPLVLFGDLEKNPAAVAAGTTVWAVFFAVFVVAGWWYPRLILGQHTVERKNIGYTLKTHWGNIGGIRLEPGSEGFILRYPMEDRGAYRFAIAAKARFGNGGIRPYNRDVLALIGERRFLPIEAFAYWLRHGSLRREIERRAPWLTDDLKTRTFPE
jgi:hypothetical protein